MAFLNPLILVAGLLVGVPIILHMLMQRKPQHIVFPALRFVLEKRQTNQRKLHLRHLLLLLLRCLLIGAIVVAFAGPSVASNLASAWIMIGGIGLLALIVGILTVASIFLLRPINWALSGILIAITLLLLSTGGYFLVSALQQGKDVVIAKEYEPVAAILVVDTSPRMQYLEANQTRLEKAKQIGKWLISQFPAGSEVSIVDSETLSPFFSADISAAKKRLEAIEHTYLVRSIAQQVRESVELIKKSERKQREIYVFSDLSELAWNANKGELKAVLNDSKDFAIYVIDVSAESNKNFLLSELQLSSDSTTKNGTVNIKGQLIRNGEADQKTIQMKLEQPDDRLPARRDGKTLVPESKVVSTKEIQVSENGSTEFEFQVSELKSGVHHGTIEIVGQDGLPIDDKRFFTIQVRKAWKVLIVVGQGVKANNVEDTLIEDSGSQYEIKVIEQERLSNNELENYQAVFLLNPSKIFEGQWSQLQRYCENGGNVLITLGHNAVKDGFAEESFTTDLAQSILPGKLTNVFRAPPSARFINPDSYTHPILGVFQPYATTNPWNQFPVIRHWGIELDNDESLNVILKLSDGSPALIEQKVGKGQVLTMTTPFTEPSEPENRKRWNDLMIGDFWPSWLLIRNIGRHLVANRESRLNYMVGDAVVLDNEAGLFPKNYQMFTPRDEVPATILPVENEMIYQFTDIPGVFRLKGRLEELVLRGFSVNLPIKESDLTKIKVEELDEILGKDRYQLARDETEISRQQGTTRVGQQFFPMLIGLFAIFLFLEHLMANWFYRTQIPARQS